jgi:hypothetical protein
MASVVIVVQVDDEAEAVTTLVLRGAVIRRAPGLDEMFVSWNASSWARHNPGNSSGSSSALTMDTTALYSGGSVHSRLTGWSWRVGEKGGAVHG